MVTVQVPSCVDVRDSDDLSASDGSSPLAYGVHLPSDSPVTVAVVHRGHSGNRLLPAAF